MIKTFFLSASAQSCPVKWISRRYLYIQDRNDERLYDVSLELCMYACQTHSAISCVSVEYNPTYKECVLSTSNLNSDGIIQQTDYSWYYFQLFCAGETLPDYDFYH